MKHDYIHVFIYNDTFVMDVMWYIIFGFDFVSVNYIFSHEEREKTAYKIIITIDTRNRTFRTTSLEKEVILYDDSGFVFIFYRLSMDWIMCFFLWMAFFLSIVNFSSDCHECNLSFFERKILRSLHKISIDFSSLHPNS